MAETMDTLNFEEDTQKGKFLTFSLGKETYGIEILHVTEIIGIQDITVIPQALEYIKGVINLRGKIIPVLDVRLRFKMPPKEYTDRTCVIVIDIRDVSVGLVVDSVADVLNIADSDIVEAPQFSLNRTHRFMKHIGKVGSDVILILDCDELLTEEEIDMIEQIDEPIH